MSTKRKHRAMPDRHAGILMNRESKFPIEIMDKAGHSIFLNPLKRMIKNRPYVKDEYILETKRMIEASLKKIEADKIEEQKQASEQG